MKKAISALTALVLTFTVFMGAIPVGAEETRSDGQTSLENDISVTGTNSFGNLLSDELSGKMDEQQQNNGCNIFSAEVTGNEATVSFETVESATLLVAVYDEAGEQMLASGHEEVTQGETEKTVTIETDSMPEYFYLRAFLVDTNTLRPICTAYQSPNYTREMQEFFAKTVDDFDSEKVLNLDEDKSNNFAVYGEDTKVIESDGVVNKIAKSDEENGIYVIENADGSMTSLAKDDVFALAQPDGNVLIAKVGSVNVSGKTVTITEQETSMEEVFDYVKIDDSKGTADAEIDDTELEEGVIYNGLVDYVPESRTYSGETTYNSNEAYLPAGPDYQALEIDEKGKVAQSYTFKEAKIEKGKNNATISGGIELSLTAALKVYKSTSYSYLEMTILSIMKVDITISGTAEGEKKLKVPKFHICAGVFIEPTPSFIIKANAEVEVNGIMTQTVGFRVDNTTGYNSLNTTPIIETRVTVEGTFFLGVALEPKIEFLSDKILSVGLKATLGAEIKAELTGGENTDSEIHACKKCISGDISGKLFFSATVTLAGRTYKFLTTESNEGDDSGFSISHDSYYGFTFKICDFYYSFDKKEFGLGSCPYEKYKVSICVKDENGNPVSGAEITARGTSDNVSGETDEKGRFETWLSNDNWSTLASKGDKYAFKVLTINEPKNVTIIIKSKSDKPNISVESQRLSLGDNHSGYIDDNGNLYMWGLNTWGQLGNGKTEKRSLIPIKIMDNVKAVSLGYFRSAAITEDGSLYEWGHNHNTPVTPYKTMDNVKAVSLDHYYQDDYAAITEDGSLHMYRDNEYGQRGDYSTLKNVKAVSLGMYHSAAITEDGSLYMWGLNSCGQLGNGEESESGRDENGDYLCSSTPIKIMDNVKAVSLGGYHSAAITNDGSLYMWGLNNNGQLGNGEAGRDENRYQLCSSTPIKIMDNVKSVSLGMYHSAAITNDGSLYMWGENYYGQLGNGQTVGCGSVFEYNKGIDIFTPIKIMDNVKEVSLGSYHSGAITEDGSLYTWGYNDQGQLGNGNTYNSGVPIKITIPSASAKTIPNTEYLANEPTLQTAEFTGLLPNEVYNFYSILNNELLYISQGVSDKNGNLDISYIPKKDDTGAEIFLKGMTRTDISGAEVTVTDILCNGEEQFAQPVVTLDGVTLSEADYDIAMQYSAVYPGEYDITIVGVGDYTGEVAAVYNVYCKHSFSDGKCTICKSLEGTLGDVNEDGAVGVADIVALQKFIVRKKTAFPKNGDVNGDGKINVFDVVKLKRILIYS